MKNNKKQKFWNKDIIVLLILIIGIILIVNIAGHMGLKMDDTASFAINTLNNK